MPGSRIGKHYVWRKKRGFDVTAWHWALFVSRRQKVTFRDMCVFHFTSHSDMTLQEAASEGPQCIAPCIPCHPIKPVILLKDSWIWVDCTLASCGEWLLNWCVFFLTEQNIIFPRDWFSVKMEAFVYNGWNWSTWCVRNTAITTLANLKLPQNHTSYKRRPKGCKMK